MTITSNLSSVFDFVNRNLFEFYFIINNEFLKNIVSYLFNILERSSAIILLAF